MGKPRTKRYRETENWKNCVSSRDGSPECVFRRPAKFSIPIHDKMFMESSLKSHYSDLEKVIECLFIIQFKSRPNIYLNFNRSSKNLFNFSALFHHHHWHYPSTDYCVASENRKLLSIHSTVSWLGSCHGPIGSAMTDVVR